MKNWVPPVSISLLGFYLGGVGLKLTAFCRALSVEEVRPGEWRDVINPLSFRFGSEDFTIATLTRGDIGEGLATFLILAAIVFIGLWTTVGALFFSQLLTGRRPAAGLEATRRNSHPILNLSLGWLTVTAVLILILVPRELRLLILATPVMAICAAALVMVPVGIQSRQGSLARSALIWLGAGSALLAIVFYFTYFHNPQRSLIAAARTCTISSLTKIIAKNGKLDGRDRIGRTALTEAAAAGCLEGVRILLDHGAAVDRRGGEWSFPNHTARERMFEPGVTALWIAAARGDLDMVKFLISRGAEPDIACVDSRFGGPRLLGLMGVCSPLAVSGKNIEVSTYLLNHGAQVNYWTGVETALHFAVKTNDPALVRLLVEHGADLSAQDNQGRTPLACARFWKKNEIAADLERAEAGSTR